MELTPGFKLSEAGPIPEDWGVATYENVCRITTGSRNTQDAKPDGTYPFLVRSQTVERIDTFGFDCTAIVTAGDGVGTGKVFHYMNGKFDAHQRVYVLIPGEESDARYLFMHFSTNFLARIEMMTAKSSVDSVRREMIADMVVAMPPLPEQQAIAKVLEDVDAWIAAAEAEAAKLASVKAAAMDALLTPTTRLPGFEGEWRVSPLQAVARLHKGQLLPASYPDIVFSHYSLPAFDETGQPTIEAGKYIGSNKFTVPTGAVLLSKLNPRIPRIWATRPTVKAISSTEFLVLVPEETCDRSFFAQALQGREFQRQLLDAVTGTTGSHQRADPRTVMQIELPLPPTLTEQSAIAAVLTDIDTAAAAARTVVAKALRVRAAAMDALLSGRIRLPLP